MKYLKKIIMCSLIIMPVFFAGCLISEVDQSTAISAGSDFTATLIISEMTAETTTPHKGVLVVMVPEDWTFVSGTYDAQTSSGQQTGDMLLNTEETLVYGDIDTIIAPPAGMKWVDLLSEEGYLHPENAVFEVTVTFRSGTTTGIFPIGYASTKNTADMMGSFNPEDEDNTSAWTDTSMNHMVTVSPAVSVRESKLDGVPSEFKLNQNYPNPFNPSTKINYSVASGTHVKIVVYDAAGKETSVLADGYKSAGNYSIDFSASGLTSGVYYYRIEAGNFVQTNKMIFLK